MFYFILSYFKTKQTRLPNESCKTWDWIQFIFRLAALTYRWARQASTRSSCCAAGPGSSEWLAPYPGSCWASPSTAPYLPRDKYARSSLILLSSRPPLTMRGQRFSDERERKKNPKKKKCEKKWEKCAPEGWAELSHAKLNWTLGPLVRFCEYEADGEREESSFYFALPRRQKNKSPTELLNIIIYYSDCWQKQTEAAFCWVRIPDVWPLNPANSSRKKF